MKTRKRRNSRLFEYLKNIFFIEHTDRATPGNPEPNTLNPDPLYLNYRDAYQQATRWK